MTSSFYILEKQFKNPRKCCECKTGMAEGYLDETLGLTFCSKKCLNVLHDPASAEKLMEFGRVFWTTWYDEIEGWEEFANERKEEEMRALR